MAALRDLGCEVRIVTSNSNHLNAPGLRSESLTRVETQVLQAPRYSKGKSLMRVVSWVIFDLKVSILGAKGVSRPDVIIASSPSILTLVSGQILAKRLGAHFVPELRDLWPITGTEEYGFSRRNPIIVLVNLIERWALTQSRGVIGMVPGIHEYLASRVQVSPPAAVIELGIDREFSKSLPNPVDRKGSTRLIVGYAGSVGRTNNVETMLRAAKLLVDEENIQFRVFGQGDELQSLRDQYGLLPNVVFYGRVSREQLAAELDRCDVLHFSCLDSELWQYGQSLNKVVEYMLSARPVIASFSGRQSMIDEAKSGSFVAAEDPQSLSAKILDYSRRTDDQLNEEALAGYHWIVANRTYNKLAVRLLIFLEQISLNSEDN